MFIKATKPFPKTFKWIFIAREKINFMDPSNTFAICVPYEKLFLQEYGWFLRLSKEQFNQSNLEIKRLLKEINLK